MWTEVCVSENTQTLHSAATSLAPGVTSPTRPAGWPPTTNTLTATMLILRHLQSLLFLPPVFSLHHLLFGSRPSRLSHSSVPRPPQGFPWKRPVSSSERVCARWPVDAAGETSRRMDGTRRDEWTRGGASERKGGLIVLRVPARCLCVCPGQTQDRPNKHNYTSKQTFSCTFRPRVHTNCVTAHQMLRSWWPCACAMR